MPGPAGVWCTAESGDDILPLVPAPHHADPNVYLHGQLFVQTRNPDRPSACCRNCWLIEFADEAGISEQQWRGWTAEEWENVASATRSLANGNSIPLILIHKNARYAWYRGRNALHEATEEGDAALAAHATYEQAMTEPIPSAAMDLVEGADAVLLFSRDPPQVHGVDEAKLRAFDRFPIKDMARALSPSGPTAVARPPCPDAALVPGVARTHGHHSRVDLADDGGLAQTHGAGPFERSTDQRGFPPRALACQERRAACNSGIGARAAAVCRGRKWNGSPRAGADSDPSVGGMN
ncbi:hypothetical protein N9L68_05120 [bacterium]|nr:hypothetical protein [bacterium]